MGSDPPDGSDCENPIPSWMDMDGDGFGDPDQPDDPCEPSEFAVENDEDCDDTTADVSPDASESCETEADDDCDGSTNGVDALGWSDYYLDLDGDGYGLQEEEVCVCEAWESYTTQTAGDCDDSAAEISPDDCGELHSALCNYRILQM